ncbi:MAG: SAM-dependent DNA methyltransferase [Candidatus Methanofastidiosa archaeon]|nr:SAM-dependent DNA methyltransferase [Candidatus Methanofastidiosa archaeon]
MKNYKLSSADYNKLVSFIWSIADDCLRDVYVRGKYRDIILPMTVIRRFDAILEPKKREILELKELFIQNQAKDLEAAMGAAIELPFYNISKFTLKDLKSETSAQNLKKNFEDYLNGFSPNVREILEKFKFYHQLDTMTDAGILGSVIEKFVSSEINLSPYPELNSNGEVLKPGLDNHTMGVMFEELIRRFNEENNEEAGEHFTPRDVIELMADIAIIPIEDQIKDAPYTLYDGAAGTLGMCTVASEKMQNLAKKKGKNITTHIFGQEINPETYAIAKADMLVKGQGQDSDNIYFGSTISNDHLAGKKFDFMLSNPPYGKNWKTDLEKIGAGSSKNPKDNVTDPRFVTEHRGEGDFRMIPDVSDGQLLFLLNNIAKMKDTEMGSRIVEVHNGSALFTGGVGNGANNARKYMIENDLIETIIELPENIFYNTGISTYIWVLSNRKEEKRKGKIQLINASTIKTTLRKNMGKKNCELSRDNQKQILNLYLDFEENNCSKIFENKEFGYWQVTVERPLRQAVRINDDTLKEFNDILKGLGVLDGVLNSKALKEYQGRGVKSTKGAKEELADTEKMKTYQSVLLSLKSEEDYLFYADFKGKFNEKAKGLTRITLNNLAKTGLLDLFVKKNERAEIVMDSKGNPVPDKELRDTEQIPLTYEGGINAFIEKEVLPYHPDAWVDKDSVQVGYEINFTKYFYEPKGLPQVKEIVEEIKRLEKESDGLMDSILEGLDYEI